MSDLYDMFGAAASRNPGVDAERREVLVTTIGSAAVRRRRRRIAGTSLLSVTGVAAAVGTLLSLGIGLGGDADVAEPGHADPSDPTTAASAATASPPPSEGPTSGPTVWDLAASGWFMVETRTADDQMVRTGGEDVARASGGAVVLVGPDGRTYDAGSLDDVAYTEVFGWEADGLRLFTETEDGSLSYGRGDVAVWNGDGGPEPIATGVDAPFVAAWLDGESVVQQRLEEEGFVLSVSDDYSEQEPLCLTADDAGAASVSPDGAALVCFTALTPDGTDVTVVPIEGGSRPELLATFTYPAWTYSRIGWVSDTVLLFARFTDPGYRYFMLDIETAEVTEIALPDTLDGSLPAFDQESDTFRLVEDGLVAFTASDGDVLAEVVCEGAKRAPVVALSGSRALVACEEADDGSSVITLVNLETGVTSEVLSLDASDGADPLGGMWGYPPQRSQQ